MLFQSQIISRGSGSIGGLTASHNKGGNYFRARTTPTDPSTAFQTVIRNAAASLVNFWNDVLSQLQRDEWATYATNVPLLNPFGEPRTVTPLNMYVRTNVSRLQNGMPRVDDAPVLFNLGEFTPTSGVSSEGAQSLAITFDNTDQWANEDDSAMLVYISRPQNPGINFFKGPYRLAGKIDGDGITPPTSPAVIVVPFTITLGQRLFWRIRVTRDDGRLSFIERTTGLVIV